MKKILALILATFMMLSMFAACGRDDKEKKETEKPKAETKKTEEKEEKEVSKIESSIEKDVEAFVKATILRELDDDEWVVFEHINEELKEKYKEVFDEKKDLGDMLKEKVKTWEKEKNRELDEDDEKKEDIKNIAKNITKYIDEYLENGYYTCDIEVLDSDEKSATVKAEVTRKNLVFVGELLDMLLYAKKVDFEDEETIKQKISEIIDDMVGKNGKMQITETFELTLKKQGDGWIVTNDGSLSD